MVNHILGFATQVVVMAIVISVILLFLGISVLILIHVCIVGRSLRTTGTTESTVNLAERGSIGSTSLSREDIEKLPSFDFRGEEEKGSGSPIADCAVCLEKFMMGEKCRLLPSCNHSFHAECVDMWLLRTPICPICRAVAADVINIGSSFGEDSSRFTDSGMIEMRDDQVAESGELADEVAIDISAVQGGENGSANSTSENRVLSESGTEVAIQSEEIGTCNASQN